MVKAPEEVWCKWSEHITMSETILKILLSELTTIRIRCKRCRLKGTLEMPIAKLDRVDNYSCPICREPFWKDRESRDNHLANLQEALEGLAEDAERVEIEFVIAEQQQPPTT